MNDDAALEKVRLTDWVGACCGSCAHWDRAKKRNCSNPDTPVYYAECLYPVEEMRLPHCISFDETYEGNGTNCPCFTKADEAPNAGGIRLAPTQEQR